MVGTRAGLLLVLLALVSALTLAFPVMTYANEYADNPRASVNRQLERQFAPIGELEDMATSIENQVTVRRYGTGFLISPCYILTAHHVVFGHDPDPIEGKDYSMKFRVGPGPNADTAFLGNTIATPVKWGSIGMGAAGDWAILKLRTCVGGRRDIGWFESADLPDGWLIGQHVAVAGYAGDFERGTLSLSEGDIKYYYQYQNALAYSASTKAGESGAPVLLLIDGDEEFVGINVTHRHREGATGVDSYITYSDDISNYFIPSSEIVNRTDIRMMLDTDKRSLGSANPHHGTTCFLAGQSDCKRYIKPPCETNAEAYDRIGRKYSTTSKYFLLPRHDRFIGCAKPVQSSIVQ